MFWSNMTILLMCIFNILIDCSVYYNNLLYQLQDHREAVMQMGVFVRGDLDKKGPHMSICLNIRFPVGKTIGEGLGGGTLLKEVCSLLCVGFQVSKVHTNPSVFFPIPSFFPCLCLLYVALNCSCCLTFALASWTLAL